MKSSKQNRNTPMSLGSLGSSVNVPLAIASQRARLSGDKRPSRKCMLAAIGGSCELQKRRLSSAIQSTDRGDWIKDIDDRIGMASNTTNHHLANDVSEVLVGLFVEPVTNLPTWISHGPPPGEMARFQSLRLLSRRRTRRAIPSIRVALRERLHGTSRRKAAQTSHL